MLISQTAVVEADAIGSGARVGDFAVVRAGAQLGRDVVIHPHVVVEPGVTIGDGVEVFPGAYIGKKPKGAGATTLPLEFEQKVTISANCVIGPNTVVYYDTVIGESTLIGDSAQIRERCIIGNKCVVGTHVSVGYDVKICNRVRVMEHVHVVGKSLIEDDVFIGPNVGMANDPFVGRVGFEEAHILGVTIKKGAVVGVGATLLPGVEIGEEAVVAAGTVVSIDVPPTKLVAGTPARILRKIGSPIGKPQK